MSLGKTPAERLEKILDFETGLELTEQPQYVAQNQNTQPKTDFFSHYKDPSKARRVWNVYLLEFARNPDISVEELDDIWNDLLSFNDHNDLDLYLNSLLVSDNNPLNIPFEQYRPRMRDDWPEKLDASVILDHFIGTPASLKKPLFYTDGKGNCHLV